MRESVRTQANRRNSYLAFWTSSIWPLPSSCHSLTGLAASWTCSCFPNTLWAIISYLRAFAHASPTPQLTGITFTLLSIWKTFYTLFGTGFRLYLLWEVFLGFFLPILGKIRPTLCLLWFPLLEEHFRWWFCLFLSVSFLAWEWIIVIMTICRIIIMIVATDYWVPIIYCSKCFNIQSS